MSNFSWKYYAPFVKLKTKKMGAVAPIKNKKFIYPAAFIERPKYDLALLHENPFRFFEA